MTLIKAITDKKVNFEFNKEFINVFSNKIKLNDTEFLNKTLKAFSTALVLVGFFDPTKT